MLQLVFSIFLVWMFFRLFDDKKLIDGSNAVVFVMAPAMIILMINLILAALDSPPWAFYVTKIGYFILPFYFLKVPLEYNSIKSAVFAFAVFAISFASHEIVPILMNSQLT